MSFLVKNAGSGLKFLGVINGRGRGFFLGVFSCSGYVVPFLGL